MLKNVIKQRIFVSSMLFASLMVMHTAAWSNPLLEVVDVNFRGDQCQALNGQDGTVQLFEDEDEQVLEIFFGADFDAFTSPVEHRVRNRCRVEVTLQLPDDHQVAPAYINYLGAAGISPEGRGIVTARYRLAGKASPTALEVFPGGFSEGFIVQSPEVNRPRWSQCGGQITLIADANIVAEQDPEEDESSFIIVDDALGNQVLSCGYSIRQCD